MKAIRKVPYGQANYETIVKDDFVYVDKTNFIEALEKLSERFLFFLRPRRFGKSLFVSTLQYYYGKEHKEKFQTLFGNTYIGKNPTPIANGYYVVKFDFSNINTETKQGTLTGFNKRVESAMNNFNTQYGLFSQQEMRELLANEQPGERLAHFFDLFRNRFSEGKIYILIDEYDHFANEIIAFNFEHFAEIVSRNGYVRKFYEALKAATGDGIVERMFVTGVTPITLDSLTSGFNIGSNISLKPKFNELMGFTKDEVRFVLREACEEGKFNEAELIEKMEGLYNGSLFSSQASTRLYNSDMVLYFIKEYEQNAYTFPRNLLDKNVSSDYSKIRKMMAIKNPEQNREVLKQIIFTGEIDSDITEQYSFELGFSETDFISLLFYNGMLTIKEARGVRYRLQIPNYVIRELYWSFFTAMLEEREHITANYNKLVDALEALAHNNDMRPWVTVIEDVVKALSNRDSLNFDEKHLKMIFFSYIALTNMFIVKSEAEENRGYADLLLLSRGSFKAKYQFLIELKYLPKEKESKLESVTQQAIEQIKKYREDPFVKQLESLKCYVIVFVGTEAFYSEQ